MLDPADAAGGGWTIQRVLVWAAEDFRRRGFDSPRLEAELLLAHALGTDRLRLILDANVTPGSAALSTFRDLIKRRRRAEPVAYIVGVREFFGLPIAVDRRVLVPRPETEILVETALERTRNADLYGEALDLCTGSGCVAIAFARRRPTWRVTGVDISGDALDVARENARRLGAVWGVDFVESDLATGLAGEARFDLVIANPPYVPTGDLDDLPRDVRDHEPRLALDGGSDGLALVARVVRAAVERLRPGGVVALEVGAGQAAAATALLAEHGFEDRAIRRDYAGIERVVSGRRPA